MTFSDFIKLHQTYQSIIQRAEVTVNKYVILHEEFEILMQYNCIVNAKLGGLLVGPLHSDGGIKVIWIENGDYIVGAEFEGFEYLLNKVAAEVGHETINQLNNLIPNRESVFDEYTIPENIRILNSQPLMYGTFEFPRFLYIDTLHWIINKHATKAVLEILNELNEKSIPSL